MFNVLEHFGNIIEINCEECDNKFEINFNEYASEEDFSIYSSERSMGQESQHSYSDFIQCDVCEHENKLEILVVEYPLYTYNFSEVKVNGN